MIPVRVGLNLLAHYIITFCFLGKVTQDTRPVGWGGSVGSVDPPRSSELVPLAIKRIYS